jgi:hypothetical protein
MEYWLGAQWRNNWVPNQVTNGCLERTLHGFIVGSVIVDLGKGMSSAVVYLHTEHEWIRTPAFGLSCCLVAGNL